MLCERSMLDEIQKKQRTVALAIISNTYRSIQMTTNSNIGISIYTKKKHIYFSLVQNIALQMQITCIQNTENDYSLVFQI